MKNLSHLSHPPPSSEVIDAPSVEPIKKDPKQVIVLRNDLNMRKGKMVAQGSHASEWSFLQHAEFSLNDKGETVMSLILDAAMMAWLNAGHKKICLYVKSEDELKRIYEEAKSAGLLCSLVRDSGLTEFNGVPTLTACAIGPAEADQIDIITSKLPIL